MYPDNDDAPRPRSARSLLEWYSISVRSVRRAVTLILVALVLLGATVAYRHWEQRSHKVRSTQLIEEATRLVERMETRRDYERLRLEHNAAWDRLEQARIDYEEERYSLAVDRAQRSVLLLQSILRVGQQADGKSRFLSVSGGVELRRGERGAWRRARGRDPLDAGDWIKTGPDGTAEVLFPNGTVYTLRPRTLMEMKFIPGDDGDGEEVDMPFGTFELSSGDGPGRVTTPRSEARWKRRTDATVSFNAARTEGTFAAFDGELDVVSSSGETRKVASLQQVDQRGDSLSEPRPLPGRPRLVQPSNDQEINFAAREMRLAWQPVDRAARYSLRLARSPLFAENFIDVDNRRKTSARLGIRGEGSFFWQVAAIDEDGLRGPWSEARRFRVASLGSAGDGDVTPPEIVIEEAVPYGTLVLVNGRTEPGATVTINGEAVSVGADGSFSKTIQMRQAGFAFVKIVATDAWNNTTEKTRRVFIDAL